MNGKSVTVSGLFKAETEKAILVAVDEDDHWFPKSKIQYDGEIGESVDVIVPAWLAEQQGLAE
jgi:hypothetical protein